MKKRVLAGIMMAAMMVASVMSVSAAGSKTDEVEVSKDNTYGYTVEAEADTFKDLDAEAQTAIKDLNDGKISDSIVADIKDIKTTLSGKKLVCPVFDLEPFGEHPNCTNGHTVKLNVPALKNCDPNSVVVLHYSETDKAWEVVEAKVSGTTLTATFENLSPVAIYAKVTTGGAAGTSSPSTVGTSSTWMLLAAVAVVALGAGVVATQKKSR